MSHCICFSTLHIYRVICSQLLKPILLQHKYYSILCRTKYYVFNNNALCITDLIRRDEELLVDHTLSCKHDTTQLAVEIIK